MRGKAAGAIDAKRRGDPAFADFRIADSPFYLLARTTARYSIDMENALHAIDMDLPSWRTLMILSERNPSSVSEIAERAVMRLSTMTRVIQRLEKRGLLKVKRRKGDARVTEVYINSNGASAARQVRDIASRFYNIAFHDFEAAEIDGLNALLRRVFGNLALRPERAAPRLAAAEACRGRALRSVRATAPPLGGAVSTQVGAKLNTYRKSC